MTNRRHFLSILGGASCAAAACTSENASPEDDLERTLQELEPDRGYRNRRR